MRFPIALVNHRWIRVVKDLVKADTSDPDLAPADNPEEHLTLLQQVWEDWQAHGESFTSPGFQALAVHRFGNWRMSIKQKPLRAPFSLVYRSLFRRMRNRYGIELPYSAKVGRRVIFEHQHGVVIHGNASIADDCIIRHGVTLGNRRLDRPLDAPTLGRRVSVGAGAKILGNVVIGDDASIGANAVVCCDVPPHGHAVGVPAKVVLPKRSENGSFIGSHNGPQDRSGDAISGVAAPPSAGSPPAMQLSQRSSGH